MKNYFGYIRVSTAKQGEKGVSLQEQRGAIESYATRNSLVIIDWFEERETAAKRGRPVFNQMLRLLRQGKAAGVVIHKIDRSARNLKDWADLGELIDYGTEVHFANESLDLHSRGGRLSADIQAVVASDYIRNLREETRKGFYGRIKQGLYPLPAPLGYLDLGKGKSKEPDPIRAPLIKKAFELYGSEKYNLENLVDDMHQQGLRNRTGKKVTINGFSTILNNPFYIGLIRIKRTSETFPGSHKPLITKSLFDRVQKILSGKVNARVLKHDFLFRRLVKCRCCGYSLIGETQKGYVYYRCHTKKCPVTCVKEDEIESKIKETFSGVQFNENELAYLLAKVAKLDGDWEAEHEELISAGMLSLIKLTDRLNRLTDAYIDHVIDKSVFEERKTAILMEKKALEENLSSLKANLTRIPDKLSEFLELARSLYSSYKNGIPEEKRDLIKIVTSNRVVNQKNVELMLDIPFTEVANRYNFTNSTPHRVIPRTDALDGLFDRLVNHFKAEVKPAQESS